MECFPSDLAVEPQHSEHLYHSYYTAVSVGTLSGNASKHPNARKVCCIQIFLHSTHIVLAFSTRRDTAVLVRLGMPATRTLSVCSERFVSDTSRVARGWKERQRTRVPSIDLHDNPFCVDRRLNEEWRAIEFNRVGESCVQ